MGRGQRRMTAGRVCVQVNERVGECACVCVFVSMCQMCVSTHIRGRERGGRKREEEREGWMDGWMEGGEVHNVSVL